MIADTLDVCSTFNSIGGECGLIPQGTPTTFIRMAGCNLRCRWCDSSPAWEEGTPVRPQELVTRLLPSLHHHVLITGGEPLLQPYRMLEMLVRELTNLKRSVSIETNGTALPRVPLARMVQGWVFDYKLPGSGQHHLVLPFEELITGLQFLRGHYLGTGWGGFVKMVCSDRADFDRVRDLLLAPLRRPLRKILLSKQTRITLAIGAVTPGLSPAELWEWIEEEPDLLALPIRLNLQLHKWVWPQAQGGGEEH